MHCVYPNFICYKSRSLRLCHETAEIRRKNDRSNRALCDDWRMGVQLPHGVRAHPPRLEHPERSDPEHGAGASVRLRAEPTVRDAHRGVHVLHASDHHVRGVPPDPQHHQTPGAPNQQAHHAEQLQ